MQLGNMTVMKGEKKSGFLPIEGSKYQLPMTIICGGEGPTVLVTAGVHNAEYVGIQAVIELSQEMEPRDIQGTLILIHLVNVSGFEHRTMSLVYEDEKNINREFPGKKNGTEADKVCYTIEKELFSVADYYIDLHGGDGYEELYPYVYYVGPVKEEVRKKAFQMASLVDVDYIVESSHTVGGAYNYANTLGIPSILLERGCRGVWTFEQVEQDKKDVKRILRFLYGQEEYDRKRGTDRIILKEMIYETAPDYCCWYPFYQVGDKFERGDILGECRDYFGKKIAQIEARGTGIILYQVVSLNLLKNGPMISYGLIEDKK